MKIRVYNNHNKKMNYTPKIGCDKNGVLYSKEFYINEYGYPKYDHNCPIMLQSKLKDINGNCAFEGDILKRESLLENFKNEPYFYHILKFDGVKFFADGFGTLGFCDFEIIGNIYENDKTLEIEL